MPSESIHASADVMIGLDNTKTLTRQIRRVVQQVLSQNISTGRLLHYELSVSGE
jgi:hypothetical protein